MSILSVRHCRTAGQAASGRQSGFTLIEVIAAILLLAIAFAALMRVLGGAIALTQNAAGYSDAAMWARSKLDSAFVGEPIKTGLSAGHFNARYRWQLAVTPWNPPVAAAPIVPSSPTMPIRLYQLDLKVIWGGGPHPRSADFRTLRLGGAQSPSFGGPGAP